MVTLHHANAAQRFREAPCHLRVDFWPRAEDRANRRKRFVDAETEDQEDTKRDARHRHAGMKKINQRDHRGHKPADKLDETCSHEITNAFHVAHDSRN